MGLSVPGEGVAELGAQPDFWGSRPQPTLWLVQVVPKTFLGCPSAMCGPGNAACLRGKSGRRVDVQVPISRWAQRDPSHKVPAGNTILSLRLAGVTPS